jgi:hypothetical protein
LRAPPDNALDFFIAFSISYLALFSFEANLILAYRNDASFLNY